ncbi:hypothetical protein AgCh_001406 [Apium graveolens]
MRFKYPRLGKINFVEAFYLGDINCDSDITVMLRIPKNILNGCGDVSLFIEAEHIHNDEPYSLQQNWGSQPSQPHLEAEKWGSQYPAYPSSGWGALGSSQQGGYEREFTQQGDFQGWEPKDDDESSDDLFEPYDEDEDSESEDGEANSNRGNKQLGQLSLIIMLLGRHEIIGMWQPLGGIKKMQHFHSGANKEVFKDSQIILDCIG